MTKIQKITTSPTTAIEALSKSPDSEDLELVGHEPLVNVSKSLASAVKAGLVNSDHSFAKVFGYHTSFFYIIECVTKEKVTNYERGIATIYQKDNRNFLKRQIPIVNGSNASKCISSSSCGPIPFSCCDSDCTVLYSCVPQTFIESLCLDNCVLGTQTPFIPQPLQVQENSFLGRLDDNLQSIPLDNENFIEKIIKYIGSFTKQIKLKASKLSLKRVEPEVIDMIPTSNIKAKKGSFYYDESDDKLKVYDGEKWKTIAFVKE